MGRATLGHEDFTAEYAKYAETDHEPQQIEDEEENEDEEVLAGSWKDSSRRLQQSQDKVKEQVKEQVGRRTARYDS